MATLQPKQAGTVVTTNVHSLRRTLFIAIAIKLVLLAGLAWTLRTQRATLPAPTQSLPQLLGIALNNDHPTTEVGR
jgi:hypothetical protein